MNLPAATNNLAACRALAIARELRKRSAREIVWALCDRLAAEELPWPRLADVAAALDLSVATVSAEHAAWLRCRQGVPGRAQGSPPASSGV